MKKTVVALLLSAAIAAPSFAATQPARGGNTPTSDIVRRAVKYAKKIIRLVTLEDDNTMPPPPEIKPTITIP